MPLTSTYRVQLRSGVGFAEVVAMVPRLRELGIGALYLSPPFQARAGSTHGYDVVDPTVVDPAIGGEEGLRALAAAAHAAGMAIVVDLVPNHMAASLENPWWRDLLRFGARSPSAPVFDVDWEVLDGRVLVAVLGEPYREALERGLISVEPDGPTVGYADLRFPVAPWTYGMLDPSVAEEAERTRSLSGDKLVEATSALDARLEATPPSDLQAFLEEQPYRLAHWRIANERVNYRRFFDITDLVCVRQEDPDVFARTHETVVRLVRDGVIDGVRVDHVDGLAEPGGYLRRLRDEIERPILVEKILARDEQLPDDWPVEGTTGYETIAAIDGAFVDPQGFHRLHQSWSKVTHEDARFDAVVREAKRLVLDRLFAADLAALEQRLFLICDTDPELRDVPRADVRASLIESIVGLRVYRTYGTARDVSPDGIVGRVLAKDDPSARAFATRWRQLTGPAMAKGFEDTALYRWFPLSALNEVGGEPDDPGGVEHMHRVLAAHRGLVPGSTHDTKRGEDVRARLLALSEMPARWERFVRRWGSATLPPEVEWLLLQTMLGTWEGRATHDYVSRIVAYMRKAGREAKVHTDWLEPDERHERAVERRTRSLLRDPTFTRELDAFATVLARAGARTSIAQVAIRCAAPGIPDVYNGTESWFLRLVDPDNRGPFTPPLSLPVRRPGDVQDGGAKAFTLRAGLGARAADPALFAQGDYIALRTHGARAANLIAFARRLEDRWALCIVRRLGARADRIPWGDTAVRLPQGAPLEWVDAIGGTDVRADRGVIRAADVLRSWPAAILTGSRSRPASASR